MIRRWYLVQIDMETSTSIDAQCQTSGFYYSHFLAKHPSDAGKSDDSSRWWPDWYRYSRDSITDDVIFGDRVLFRPNITPDHSKYIQWGDLVNLKHKSCLLLGPFEFESLSPTNRTRQKVTSDIWLQLSDLCSQRGILQPTVDIHLQFNPNPSTASICIRKRKRTQSRKKTS